MKSTLFTLTVLALTGPLVVFGGNPALAANEDCVTDGTTRNCPDVPEAGINYTSGVDAVNVRDGNSVETTVDAGVRGINLSKSGVFADLVDTTTEVDLGFKFVYVDHDGDGDADEPTPEVQVVANPDDTPKRIGDDYIFVLGTDPDYTYQVGTEGETFDTDPQLIAFLVGTVDNPGGAVSGSLTVNNPGSNPGPAENFNTENTFRTVSGYVVDSAGTRVRVDGSDIQKSGDDYIVGATTYYGDQELLDLILEAEQQDALPATLLTAKDNGNDVVTNLIGIPILVDGHQIIKTGPSSFSINGTDYATYAAITAFLDNEEVEGYVSISNPQRLTGGALINSTTDAGGIHVTSTGGDGGNGRCYTFLFLASWCDDGDDGGNAGSVVVNNDGEITVNGLARAYGVSAVSKGGRGGKGGGTFGLLGSDAGEGGKGGVGGDVVVNLGQNSVIETHGLGGHGVYARSNGGDGGAAGSSSGLVATGQDGGNGGDAGEVTVTNHGLITTYGAKAYGIYAESIGAGAGSGADAGGLVAVGGDGGGESNGNKVTVTNTGTIETKNFNAFGIFAQSVGGGGGDGGDTGGLVSIGGDGGSGGNSDTVKVFNSGTVKTALSGSIGVFAQSVGGGGGNGGSAYAVGAGASVAVGGKGGPGGDGGAVFYNETADINTLAAASVETHGDRAHGLQIQSVGGGGGNGGFAFSGTIPLGGMSASVAVGGSGGDGGDSGVVTLNEKGEVSTGGDGAYGIFAQSVGGGGGSGGGSIAAAVGGAYNLSIGVGGTGGAGGDGNTVTVNTAGSIATTGLQSFGIMAQSVGGGGGNGGYSISAAVGGGISGAIALGGDGGVAGDGKAVTVNTSGVGFANPSISTIGAGANGIFAQSVGGGGGNGGVAGAGAVGGGALGVGLGGGGSGGGAGGVVIVDNQILIDTQGDNAIGIFAQSVGGGGGNGGFTLAGSGGTISVATAIGGTGSGGGAGDDVDVDNYGKITTRGALSYGVFAQSVGGGGGNGGTAVAFSAAFSPDPKIPAVAVAVAVGGDAGDGGLSGDVRVNNAGEIETHGMLAYGIFAQSVGGGGGNGGLAASGTLTVPAQQGSGGSVTVSIGGTGGDGGDGGLVVVGKDSLGNTVAGGSITTYAEGADAIHAQSIGGGGGDGGMALAINLGVTPPGATTLNVGVSVGGSGGEGGDGGIVDIFSDQFIRTFGDNASGIFAQSAGGGGGNGGNAITGMLNIVNTTDPASRAVNVAVAIGGSGGVAGDGKDVIIENKGNIETGFVFMDGGLPQLDYDGDAVVGGASSYGIFAQSIGGGGGIGGRANAINMIVGKGCGDACPEDAAVNVAMTVSVGGDGGGAGDGGVVTVGNSGNIITNGSTADGIWAQSVGGGGGAGGNGHIGTGELLPVPVNAVVGVLFGKTKQWSDLSVAVGGGGGSSGTGGVVTVTNSGNITTKGTDSNGIFAQSIGGGGGVGGKAGIGATGKLGIGAKGASGGDGGSVTVTNTGNAILETFGSASAGIFAQSVGGGGGTAGNVDKLLAQDTGPIPALNLGIGLAFTQGGGEGGDGKDVRVITQGTSTIRTHGDSAIGIFAQSVGGGGGIVGDGSGLLDNLLDTSYALGSTGDKGDAGLVKIEHIGDIETFGTNAAGIFAQSAGGKEMDSHGGHAGNVDIDLTGTIYARGLASNGIIATTTAELTNGNITVDLLTADGVISGGRSDALHTAVGVWIVDGSVNRVTNRGEITTAGGVDQGMAILAGDGIETIGNYGTVTGSFDLGAGSNTFTNEIGSKLNAGQFAYVGAANNLLNRGWISPGGNRQVMTTRILGDFEQTQDGTYGVDLDLALTTLSPVVPLVAAEADVLLSDQAISFDGFVDLTLLNIGTALPGEHRALLARTTSALTATDGFLDPVAPASAVATYALAKTATELSLDYAIDFAPDGMNPNQSAIGAYINDFQTAFYFGAGDSTAMEPVIEALFNMPDLDAYSLALNQLSPEPYLANQVSTFFGALDFESALLSCRVYDGSHKFNAEGECVWAAFGGDETTQDATPNTLASRSNAVTYRTGSQYALSQTVRAGLGFSFETLNNSVGGLSQSTGDRLQAGAALKGVFGGTTIAGTVSGGIGIYDVTRVVDLANGPSAKLDGSQNISYVSAHGRISHTFGQDTAYLRPYVDVGVSQVYSGGFTEQGNSPIALEVASSTQTFVTLEAAMEIGGEISMVNHTVLRPFASVGVIAVPEGANPDISAQFIGAPASVDGFTVYGDVDDILMDVKLGIDVISYVGYNFRALADAQLGETTTNVGGTLKFAAPF